MLFSTDIKKNPVPFTIQIKINNYQIDIQHSKDVTLLRLLLTDEFEDFPLTESQVLMVCVFNSIFSSISTRS